MRIEMCTEPMSAWERAERDRERWHERMDTLARNLAVAGALHEAHWLGWRSGWQGASEAVGIGDDYHEDWSPGCGRASPRRDP